MFSDSLKRSAYTSDLRFDTPLVIFGYNLGNSFSLSSALNDFPEREIVTDVITGVETERIYAQTYHSYFDWTPTFTLPALARNNFNLATSMSIAEGGWRGARHPQRAHEGPVGVAVVPSELRRFRVAHAVRIVRRLRSLSAVPAFHLADDQLQLRAPWQREQRVSRRRRPHEVQHAPPATRRDTSARSRRIPCRSGSPPTSKGSSSRRTTRIPRPARRSSCSR